MGECCFVFGLHLGSVLVYLRKMGGEKKQSIRIFNGLRRFGEFTREDMVGRCLGLYLCFMAAFLF